MTIQPLTSKLFSLTGLLLSDIYLVTVYIPIYGGSHSYGLIGGIIGLIGQISGLIGLISGLISLISGLISFIGGLI